MKNEMFHRNDTIKQSELVTESELFLEVTEKINVFANILAIIIGIFGNLLTIFVYSYKKFRVNSSNVYLLCLAINNCLFLIVHFFDDVIRTYKQIFLNDENKIDQAFYDFIISINIIDRFSLACRLGNYFRYVLRFISAYIVLSFTIQRLFLVYSPLTHKLRYKKTAWLSVGCLILISLLINYWVLYLFDLRNQNGILYCDMKTHWRKEYFHITIIYISITLLIPSVIIVISNTIIIFKTYKKPKKPKIMFNLKSKTKNIINSNKKLARELMPSKKSSLGLNSTKSYLSTNKIVAKISSKTNSAKKVTKVLLFISFSFVVLNLPYLITWLGFYYGIAFKNLDQIKKNYLFAALQISEIFYILNYGLLFYLFSASGFIFKNRFVKPKITTI
jgi:hypothetical protein